MNKAKKSLLFSLLSLVFALAITATSTYAWFVVNQEVTASNMQVTVRSDTTFLVIKAPTSASAAAPTTTAELGELYTASALAADTTAVLPVRYREGGVEPASGKTRWETNSGTSYNEGAAANVDYTQLSAAEAEGHYVKYTFYVGLTDTTALNATNLRVKSLTVSENGTAAQNTFRPAISAMVECVQASESIDNCTDFADITSIANYDAETTPGTRDYPVLAAQVTKGKVYTINVYVYVNGDNAVVKSANAANVAGFTVELKLQVTPGVYSA